MDKAPSRQDGIMIPLQPQVGSSTWADRGCWPLARPGRSNWSKQGASGGRLVLSGVRNRGGSFGGVIVLEGLVLRPSQRSGLSTKNDGQVHSTIPASLRT